MKTLTLLVGLFGWVGLYHLSTPLFLVCVALAVVGLILSGLKVLFTYDEESDGTAEFHTGDHTEDVRDPHEGFVSSFDGWAHEATSSPRRQAV